jgi:beta-glucosidase
METITDLLKNELGFKGFVVSDWEGINQLSPDLKTAVDSGVNAGIDMIMEPYIPDSIIADLKELVSDGKVTEARIDDAVKRILTVKFRLGIFEHPYASLSLADSLGNDYHRSIARRAVRESQVLLKNNNRLIPLSKTSGKILVAGSKANDIGSQCGGWTLTWQGMTGNFIPGTTILDAIKTVRDSDNVIYSSNGSTTSNVDVAVVVVGETPYAEGYGDNSILNLSSSDLNTITNVKNLNIPYVVILLSGRPLMIESTINDADAFIASWLPGTEAMGITDVLFGDYLFTGKLSHTWPVSISQVPINFNDSPYNPLFPYDYGLTGNEPVNIDNTVISNVTVFPNPASKIININCASQISGIRIYNLQGVLVYSGNNYSENEHFSVNISELKSGAYCLVILGNNREKSFSVLFNKQ